MKNYFILLFSLTASTLVVEAQSAFDVKAKTVTNSTKPAFTHVQIKGNTLQKSSLVAAGNSLMESLDKVQPTGQLSQSKNRQTIVRSPKTGLPIFIFEPAQNFSTSRAIYTGSASATASTYLSDLSSLMGLTDASSQFQITKIETDPLGGMIVRLKQYYNSIEIDGCESIIHINAVGAPSSWNGSYIKPELIRKNTFAVSSTAAIVTAVTDLKKEKHFVEMSDAEKAFLNYLAPEVKSVYYIDDKLSRTCVPAYIITIRPNFVDWWEYVVDAQTGNILSSHSKTCHVDGPTTSTGNDLNGHSQTINTYLKGSTYYTIDASRSMYKASLSSMPDNPVGAIQTLDLGNTWGDNTSFKPITSTTNTFNATALSAHYIAGKAFEYYQTIHKRNSIDGNGGTIISFINVADPEDGSSFDNAFWNGKAMYYGNGNTLFKPLAGGLDVGGHELTHGVIQSTANLNYQGESGAINESMADIFGCMVDSLDWQIGEDVVIRNQYKSGALRDLSDPHNGGTSLASRGWQPRILSERYTGQGDNGGVHINSGIPNYAFYLLAQATKRSIAEKIFYRALTTYLIRSSQFIDLRIACIAAATELYKNTPDIAVQTGIAFDQVEITSTSGKPVNPQANNIPPNPGKEYMLAYNTDINFSETLYKTIPSSSTPTALSTVSTTSLFNKASVTDDGSIACFVNEKNQLVALNLQPGNKQEIIIEDKTLWNTVALSRDGNRLAATTMDQDTAIYVYDFVAESWAMFILYSPTFSDGVKSGGPIYADALEWDITSQYLIYDCYNEFENTDGTNISFWDINFIRVWDNTGKDFADGTITKLFSSLPDHVSIGNPTFAKNSSNIIAFDYIDEASGELYIIGCNTNNNTQNIITYSNVLGYPNYNITDSKIAYTYNMSSDQNTTPSSDNSIWTVDLAADKISALRQNDDVGYLSSSQWPVYFATGVRTLPTSVIPKNNSTNTTDASSCQVYPNPSHGDMHIQLKSTEQTNALVKISTTAGQVLYTNTVTLITGDNNIPVTIPANTATGYYIITIESGDNHWVSRFIKM